MSEHRARGLTDGYLPTAAFVHLDPTAVGYVDLDAPPEITVPAPSSSTPRCRDTLVLVRLHEQPLAVVYLPHPPGELSPQTLAAAIWCHAGAEIREHCARFGCCRPPSEERDLVAGLASPTPGCPGARPAAVDATVAVVIPTAGRTESLARCLDSLARLSFGPFEVIVVDNRPELGDSEATVRAAAGRGLSARYVAEPRPGSSIARNRGILEATADLVAFTDDDVVVDTGWLRWLVAGFEDPRVAVVTGMVLPLELRTEAQKRFEQYAGFSKGVAEHRYGMRADRASDRLLYPYWGGLFGSGNSMAFRRRELVAAGGFDPALGAGSVARAGGDIEAFTAAVLRGGQLVYQPRALCWHEHRHSEGALRRQLFNYGVGFTAILSKYLAHDPRFLRALARSAPLALHQIRSGPPRSAATLPRSLARLERRGMLAGPWLYTRSRRWARRLRLDEVVRGR